MYIIKHMVGRVYRLGKGEVIPDFFYNDQKGGYPLFVAEKKEVSH